MPSPIEPTIFGDFLLVQRLHASAMAEVLLAVRLGDRSGRTFVVKRPLLGERPSGRAAQAIAREAEVLGSAKVPGLPILEAEGSIAGLPYLATEYLRGGSLRSLIARGALSSAASSAIAKDLAATLAALHEAGWVHGDVSPSNVLVDDTGEARLIDLGLATRVGDKRSEIAGTVGYVAPEAVRATIAQPAEDVYGWGAVVAECALGAPVFHERELTDAAARGDGPAEIGDLPPALADDVRAALRRDPAVRPAAAAIADRLASAALDREALAVAAATIDREVDPIPDPPKSLTPTAPMVTPTRIDAIESAPRDRRRDPPNLWRALAIALLVMVAGAAGIVAGRATRRAPTSSLAFAPTFPRTAQLELDGHATAPPIDGTPVPIAAGHHAVTVTLRGGERREYTFQVRAGEQVVLLPLLRLAGGAVDRAEDHP